MLDLWSQLEGEFGELQKVYIGPPNGGAAKYTETPLNFPFALIQAGKSIWFLIAERAEAIQPPVVHVNIEKRLLSTKSLWQRI